MKTYDISAKVIYYDQNENMKDAEIKATVTTSSNRQDQQKAVLDHWSSTTMPVGITLNDVIGFDTFNVSELSDDQMTARFGAVQGMLI